MISNRMRIEATIEKSRKAIQKAHKSLSRTNSQRENDIQKLSQHFDDVNKVIITGGNTSDDAASGDELMFLSRRVSMPDGAFGGDQDRDFFLEQSRRRKFMAQFSDVKSPRRKQGSTSSDAYSEEDTLHPPSSPEF